MRQLAVALVLLLAGCLGAAEPEAPVETAAGPQPVIDESRPDPTFAEVATGPAVAPDENATLAAPPRLVPGEWWKIRFRSPLTGEEVEFVRVVAKVEDGIYLFGMPHEGWYKEAVVYHTPAFGEVWAEDLSYRSHNIPFKPLQFPLTEDATWETEFSGGPKVQAKVTVDDAKTARIDYVRKDNGATLFTAVYDARIHEIREFKQATVEYEVLEHGYGFEGWVTIPRAEELVFIHGRFTPALSVGWSDTPLPTETVDIAGGYNRVTFFQMAHQPLADHTGACRQKAVAPDGTEYVVENLPGQAGPTIVFSEAKDPDGTWTFEHVAGGACFVFIEGIAYHQYDIKLPEGFVRADHSHEVIR